MEKWSNGNAKERTWLSKFIIIFDMQNSVTPILHYSQWSLHYQGSE
jgi:hypothetical protein